MNEFTVPKKNSSENFSSSRGYCSGSEQINEEEERLRQLFISCDSNHDGKLNKGDIICMCQRLNMEVYSDEIIKVLGANYPGAEITFSEFLRCRTQILKLSRQVNINNKQNHNSPEYLVHSPYYSHPNQEEYMGSCSDISAIYSSVDCEVSCKNESSNNSLEEPLSLHDMLQQYQPDLYRRWLASERENSNNSDTLSQQLLNCANKIHLTRINRMIAELKVTTRRYSQTNESRQLCQKEITRLQKEKERLAAELTNQSSRYEDRLTELHGVIGEWQRKFQNLDPFNRSNTTQIYNNNNNSSTGNNLIAQTNTIFEEDEDNNTNYDSSFFSHLIDNNATDSNNNNKNKSTEDYEKLDLSRTQNNWSNMMETSGIYSQKEYSTNPHSSPNPNNNISNITKSTICTQTDPTTCLQQQLQCVSLQHGDNKDDTNNLSSQYYEHDSANFHTQEQLSGYESLIRTLRTQLSSVMDEKDALKRQLKELQESIVQDQQHSTSNTSNYHSQSMSNCGSLFIGNSKISLDSKSTTSSSSSPARPIMGIRHQSKQLQKLQTNQEPEWVTRALGKFNQINGAILTQSDSSINSNSNNLNSNNQLNNPYFLSGAHQLLQELADNAPYPSMLEPLRRIVLEWQKYMALQDRESADKLLLQHTLSENKALSDQLTCWVAQLQSDVSALSKSNMYADQIIELLDVLLQFREMETVMYHSNNKNQYSVQSSNKSIQNPDNNQSHVVTNSNQSITDSIYYQNHYSSLIPQPNTGHHSYNSNKSTDSDRLRQGYKEQVETAAKLILSRLEDGMLGVSLNCGGVGGQQSNTGRQTPDSGAGISSTMSSGSVDVEAMLRNGGGNSSNIGSGLISPSNYQTGSPSTQSANSPNLQFPSSHSSSVPPGNSNNYVTKSSSSTTPDLCNIECRIKRALEIISKLRSQARKSIVTTQATTSTTAVSTSISSTSNASVITNVTPNNNLTHNNSSVNRNPSILHYSSNNNNNNQSSYHQYSSNSQNSSLHRNGPLRSQEPDLISMVSGQYSIEYTILLQEISSLKEERANLQTRLYLLQKDVSALQLTIDSKSANEKAMKLQLALTSTNQQNDKAAIRPNDDPSLMKAIMELREQNTLNQARTNQLVTDLQLANSALIAAFDKAKRKYNTRITRLENQLDSLNSNNNNSVHSNHHNHNDNIAEETAL